MFRIGKEEVEAVARVIESKMLFRVNDGLREAEKFEEEFSKIIGTDYAVLMTSGTGALISALAALGIGPGDEVIVPGYTFMASASAVLAVGAIPVLAEIDATMTIDPKDVEKKISKYTKAIIPVHICGYPCNMDALCEIAKKHNLYIIEDACQADGASYKGKRLGSIGDAGCFSFNYFKLISAGEGGCVTTNDRKTYERTLIYHDSGAGFRPYAGELTEHVFMGMQLRTNEISAAIMREQLKRMDGIISDLRKTKKQFIDAIKDNDLFDIVPSNDAEGDLGTILGLQFHDPEKAKAFAERGLGGLVVNSGKHIYYNWGPVMEHRGAHCEAMNPYNMPQNKDLNTTYTADMLPNTIDYINRTCHIGIYSDWTEAEIAEQIEKIQNGLKEI